MVSTSQTGNGVKNFRSFTYLQDVRRGVVMLEDHEPLVEPRDPIGRKFVTDKFTGHIFQRFKRQLAGVLDGNPVTSKTELKLEWNLKRKLNPF